MSAKRFIARADEAQGLHDGSITEVRRPVKWRGLRSGLNLSFSGLQVERVGNQWVLVSPTRTSHEYRSDLTPCPHPPGSRVWVAEAFAAPLIYRADGKDTESLSGFLGWQSSVEMPRWASRTTLEVVSVRVEKREVWEWVYTVRRVQE